MMMMMMMIGDKLHPRLVVWEWKPLEPEFDLSLDPCLLAKSIGLKGKSWRRMGTNDLKSTHLGWTWTKCVAQRIWMIQLKRTPASAMPWFAKQVDLGLSGGRPSVCLLLMDFPQVLAALSWTFADFLLLVLYGVCLKIVYPYTQWLMIIIPIKWL